MVVLERLVVAAILLSCILLPKPAIASEDAATELKVKSAFLYNFTKFVKWPTTSFQGPSDPLTICVSSPTELEPILEETVRDKKVDSHPLAVRRVKVNDIKGCQVLFISGREFPKMLPLLLGSSATGVLTVSEASDAKDLSSHSAIITFVRDSNRIRFAISNKSAEKAGMEISSKLLSLAMSVN